MLFGGDFCFSDAPRLSSLHANPFGHPTNTSMCITRHRRLSASILTLLSTISRYEASRCKGAYFSMSTPAESIAQMRVSPADVRWRIGSPASQTPCISIKILRIRAGAPRIKIEASPFQSLSLTSVTFRPCASFVFVIQLHLHHPSDFLCPSHGSIAGGR